MNIKELCDRYDLRSRKAIYDRLNALGIQLAKDGNKSFATPDQVEVLDELNDHLNNGGTLKNFTPTLNTTAIVETVQSSLNTVTPSLNNDALTLALLDYLATLNQRSPLDKYEDLERAALKKWVISSSDIEQLLGVKPKGETFTRGSFIFTKVGKMGNQSGWTVSKTI